MFGKQRPDAPAINVAQGLAANEVLHRQHDELAGGVGDRIVVRHM